MKKKYPVDTSYKKSPFFLNEKGEIEFTAVCQKCSFNCKQSFRVTIFACPKSDSFKKKNKIKSGGSKV